MADTVLAVDLGGTNMRAAVIGVPGRIDHMAGALEHAPNLPSHWPGALHEALLTDHLGVPVSLANDADLATVGEACFGAGRGAADVVSITVSTGVGAGVLLGGRLVRDPGLLQPVREGLRRDGPRALDPAIEVRTAALGDDAGLAGAAGWARVTAAAQAPPKTDPQEAA